MPANKNAVIRYQILDELLSDRHHYYTRKDLWERCNEKLVEKGYPEVSKRLIEKDLHDMEMEFDDISIDWDTVIGGKRIIRYEDQSKSIFTKKLSKDEALLLNEVLSTLGQFSGLDNFEWLDAFQKRLKGEFALGLEGDSTRRRVISFSKNVYLSNIHGSSVSNILAGMFSSIANKVAVQVEYQKFGCQASILGVYPYLLKQYNDRWYLICRLIDAQHDFLMTLSLDRILSFNELSEVPYKECYCNIDELYEDIVGITYYAGREPEKIQFAISEKKEPYIVTKPIHGSQLRLDETEQKRLHAKYPELDGYSFYQLECIPNNELKEMFYSFDKDIVVLHKGIQDEICAEMHRQMELYHKLRKNRTA